jgi:hypothetical protein
MASALSTGDLVQIGGLKAAPQHNGEYGHLVRYNQIPCSMRIPLDSRSQFPSLLPWVLPLTQFCCIGQLSYGDESLAGSMMTPAGGK